MIVSDIRKFIKNNESVTKTEISLNFKYDDEQIDATLEFLINKGDIKKIKPTPLGDKVKNCSGCPMGCKTEEMENCSPAPNFYIYKWNNS